MSGEVGVTKLGEVGGSNTHLQNRVQSVVTVCPVRKSGRKRVVVVEVPPDAT